MIPLICVGLPQQDIVDAVAPVSGGPEPPDSGDTVLSLRIISTVSDSIRMAPADPPPTPDGPDERTEKRRLLTRALAGGPLAAAGYTDSLILSRESARQVLTGPRLALLDRLRQGPADSVRSLAAELDRDKAGVSRDLALLASLDVVEYETAGRAKRPRLKHDVVLVEPIT